MNVEKELRNHKLFKQIEEIMKDPRFKKEQEKRENEIFLNAYLTFVLHSCDYLFRNHRYKANGIKKYLEFLKEQMEFVKEDEQYFLLLAEELKKETGIDVIEEFGLVVKENKDEYD